VAEPENKGKFGLGLLGALAGAALGGAIYFSIFNYLDYESKLLALAVGFLAGLGGWWLGKPGCNELGVITACFTLICIVGAQYFVARGWWMEEVGVMDESYEAQVAEARELVTAIPTGSDQEIRLYLAKEWADEDGKPDLSIVADEDIIEFRNDVYNEAQDLASGKITKEQYEADRREEIERARAAGEESEGTFKAIFIILLLSKSNLFSCAAAVALAYKMTS
jgi:hypothetical protein